LPRHALYGFHESAVLAASADGLSLACIRRFRDGPLDHDLVVAAERIQFPLKGLVPDLIARRMTVWLKEERAPVSPFGAADQRTSFTPERLAIEKSDGSVVAE
jgi:hypothetical protein